MGCIRLLSGPNHSAHSIAFNPPPSVDLVPADARSNRLPRLRLDRFGIIQLCGLSRARERGGVRVMVGVRAAPAHEGPRNGSNNSGREPTSGHSTNYGSGHLIRVFRDIGRIFSLRLPSRPPVAHWSSAAKRAFKAEDGIWSRRRQKWFQSNDAGWNIKPPKALG
jgi:hypothetical protein